MDKIKEFDYVELKRDIIAGIDFNMSSKEKIIYPKGSKAVLVDLRGCGAIIEIYEPEFEDNVIPVDVRDLRKIEP